MTRRRRRVRAPGRRPDVSVPEVSVVRALEESVAAADVAQEDAAEEMVRRMVEAAYT